MVVRSWRPESAKFSVLNFKEEIQMFSQFINLTMADNGLMVAVQVSDISTLQEYYLENKLNQDKRPSFVCIDNFDAFFSFELSYFIVNQLKDCNTQALLTTYNTCNFSNDLLRPDCYFLCSKNKIVDANNATDKELRRGHNLEKLYRGGVFSFDH